jgi:hypothetical protein
MSWLPTLRIARAAWRGRQDPAGLIKAQLSADQAPRPGAQPGAPAVQPVAPAVQPVAPAVQGAALAQAPAAVTQPAVAHSAQPGAQGVDATHTNLLLLLR